MLREIRGQTLNLVLIGMPGCGKSSLGEAVARAMGRPFVDCDAEIAARAGMPIPEIFARFGEARFRAMETEVLRDACRESGRVIATGGGSILRAENVRAMRQNGRVCFIRRAIEALPRDGRPLSSASTDAVRKLWAERRERYIAAGDFAVDNNSTLSDAAARIQEGFYEAVGH